jgi:hypothetical protein
MHCLANQCRITSTVLEIYCRKSLCLRREFSLIVSSYKIQLPLSIFISILQGHCLIVQCFLTPVLWYQQQNPYMIGCACLWLQQTCAVGGTGLELEIKYCHSWWENNDIVHRLMVWLGMTMTEIKHVLTHHTISETAWLSTSTNTLNSLRKTNQSFMQSHTISKRAKRDWHIMVRLTVICLLNVHASLQTKAPSV